MRTFLLTTTFRFLLAYLSIYSLFISIYCRLFVSISLSLFHLLQHCHTPSPVIFVAHPLVTAATRYLPHNLLSPQFHPKGWGLWLSHSFQVLNLTITILSITFEFLCMHLSFLSFSFNTILSLSLATSSLYLFVSIVFLLFWMAEDSRSRK